MLSILAMVVGIVVAATRAIGVFAPETARKMMKGLLRRELLCLVLALVAAVVGALFIWGFRLEHGWSISESRVVGWQSYVLLSIGVLMVLVGLLFLAVPRGMTGLAAKVVDLPALKLRLLALVGVLIGIFVFLLGLTM
jgi:uncharacterized protein YjeT (DUF2065 family)